jgi:hypothetical protein
MLDELFKHGPLIDYASNAIRTIFYLDHENKLTSTLAKKFFKEYVTVLNESFKSETHLKDYEMLKDCIVRCLTAISTDGEKIP